MYFVQAAPILYHLQKHLFISMSHKSKIIHFKRPMDVVPFSSLRPIESSRITLYNVIEIYKRLR